MTAARFAVVDVCSQPAFGRHAAIVILLAACGGRPSPEGTAAAPASASGTTTIAAVAQVAPPATLARTTPPEERRERDEKACEKGDAAACRKAADRYRGYGRVAGCGVARPRPKPYRKVTHADAEGDAKQFDTWIRRACDAGDQEACLQGKSHIEHGFSVSEREVDLCIKSKLDECPLYLWQAGLDPERGKTIEKKRLGYLKSSVGGGVFGDLYRPPKTRGGDTLPVELLELAGRICKTTRECDDVMMALDRAGYTPPALVPLRKTAADALVAACLGGDCVCGAAAAYLDEKDGRRLDLAKLGCDAGEPEACHLLGRATEERDPRGAVALYNVACPSVVSADWRSDMYSKAGCDRLVELHEEGRFVPKDSDRGFFYSTLACTRPGFERDHAPCVRRALYHARGYRGELRWSTMTNGDIARDAFYGALGSTLHAKECERPSVAALCKREEKAILLVTSK
jgi:TPR repeat protein